MKFVQVAPLWERMPRSVMRPRTDRAYVMEEPVRLLLIRQGGP